MEKIVNCGITLMISSIRNYSAYESQGLSIDLDCYAEPKRCRLLFGKVLSVRITSLFECNPRLHACSKEFTASGVLKIENSENVRAYTSEVSAFSDVPEMEEYFISDSSGKAIFVLTTTAPELRDIDKYFSDGKDRSRDKTTCYTYFSIRGDFEPEEITKILGITPEKTSRRGDPIPGTKNRATGEPSVYKTSSWSGCYCRDYDIVLSEMMEKTIKPLQSKIDELYMIREEYEAFLYLEVVPWIIFGDELPEFDPSLSVIDFCSKTRTTIDTDYYLSSHSCLGSCLTIPKDEIRKKYLNRAIRYDNMWLFCVSDAKDVLEDCEAAGLRLESLAAYRITPNGIESAKEHSLSLVPEDEGNYKVAMDHLSQPKHEPYIFEIWYEGY